MAWGEKSLARDCVFSHPGGPRSVITTAGDEVFGWEVKGVSPWSPLEVLDRLDDELGKLWKQLFASGRIAVWAETVSRPFSPVYDQAPPPGVAGDVERLHRSDCGRLWVRTHWLFVVFRHNASAADKIGNWLPAKRTAAATLAPSVDTLAVCDSIEAALEAAGGARRLQEYRHGAGLYSELHEVLAYLLTGTWQRQAARPAVSLRQAWATVRPFVRFSTLELRAAGAGKLIEAMGFGAYPCDARVIDEHGTRAYSIEANHLGGLCALGVEWRVSHSVTTIDADSRRAQLERKAALKQGSVHDASNQQAAAQAASGETWVDHSMAVFVLVDAPADRAGRAAAVAKLAADRVRVFNVLKETNGSVKPYDFGLYGAWLGQQPGTYSKTMHPRRTTITAANFASLAPFWKNHAGSDRPLIVFDTRHRERYGFDIAVGEVKHGFGVGHTRTGKTTLMERIVSALKLAGYEQCLFDFLQASALWVWALDGDYRILTPGQRTGLAPLARVPSELNVAHAQALFLGVVERAGGQLPSELRADLERAVHEVMHLDRAEFKRPETLLEFLDTSVSGEVARRLQPWVGSGVHAWVFGGEPDPVRWETGLVGFDFTDVFKLSEVRAPLVKDLLYEIAGRLDGRPFVHHIDEGQEFYDDPDIGPAIGTALDTYGKLKGGLWTWTTDPENAARSPIGHTIASQCATKIATPNRSPKWSSYGVTETGLGFRLESVQAIAQASASRREYVVQTPDACETIRFNVGGERWKLARALMSSNRETVRVVQGLRRLHGTEARAWLPAFGRWLDSYEAQAATILRGEVG